MVFSILIVSVLTPCTILSSFLNTKINISFKSITIILFSAFLMFGLLALLGRISAKLMNIPECRKGLWEFMLIFSNNIFIGFPIIKILVGDEALIYASVICIPCNALIFSYGLYLMEKKDSNYHFHVQEIINPCTVVSLLSVLLLFFSVKIPETVVNIVKTLGGMSTPMALIVLGLVMGKVFHLQILKEKEIYIFCFLRLIVAPVLTKLVLNILGDMYFDICRVLVITAALPASNVAIILSSKYQNDTEMAAEYVIISTVLFIFFIPIFSYFKLV